MGHGQRHPHERYVQPRLGLLLLLPPPSTHARTQPNPTIPSQHPTIPSRQVFNQPLVFDTASVNHMEEMFQTTPKFDQAVDFDVSSVTHAARVERPIHARVTGPLGASLGRGRR